MVRILLLSLVLASACASARAQELESIVNFREHSDRLATAGQPTAAQFEAIRAAGFARVIYLAFSTDRRAIAAEDELVRSLGMDYVHIPVLFDSPSAADFDTFAAVMQGDPDARTLLHCQLNFRASAFAFLYRVIYEDVPVADAKAELDSVWAPDETWRSLIFEVLERHSISPFCAGCAWTP